MDGLNELLSTRGSVGKDSYTRLKVVCIDINAYSKTRSGKTDFINTGGFFYIGEELLSYFDVYLTVDDEYILFRNVECDKRLFEF
jgi:hypothetical protein